MLGPVVGERSVLLLDGAEHLRQRKLMLPPFHGERMRAYEQVMTEAADRAIDSWPVGRAVHAAALDAVADARRDPARRLRRRGGAARSEELKRRIRAMIDPVATAARASR